MRTSSSSLVFTFVLLVTFQKSVIFSAGSQSGNVKCSGALSLWKKPECFCLIFGRFLSYLCFSSINPGETAESEPLGTEW